MRQSNNKAKIGDITRFELVRKLAVFAGLSPIYFII